MRSDRVKSKKDEVRREIWRGESERERERENEREERKEGGI